MNDEQHAFALTDGVVTTFDVPGTRFTYAFGLNDAGLIAGYSYDYANNAFLARGYTYDGVSFSAVNVPGAAETVVTGVNDSDVVVWHYFGGASDYGPHAFIARPDATAVPEPATLTLLSLCLVGLGAYQRRARC